MLSYFWTSPYKGKGINKRIYQQLPESNWSRNRPEMVRIGIGIESCPSLGIGVRIGIDSLGFSIVSESFLTASSLEYHASHKREQWFASLLQSFPITC